MRKRLLYLFDSNFSDGVRCVFKEAFIRKMAAFSKAWWRMTGPDECRRMIS